MTGRWFWRIIAALGLAYVAGAVMGSEHEAALPTATILMWAAGGIAGVCAARADAEEMCRGE